MDPGIPASDARLHGPVSTRNSEVQQLPVWISFVVALPRRQGRRYIAAGVPLIITRPAAVHDPPPPSRAHID